MVEIMFESNRADATGNARSNFVTKSLSDVLVRLSEVVL